MNYPEFPPFNRKIVLASKSPRRFQLLKEAGFKFRVLPIDVEEDYPENISVSEVAAYLAEKKAIETGCHLLEENEILLTADSIVMVNEEILNKPSDIAEAITMLNKLSGRTHKVYTGVCLYSKSKKVIFTKVTSVSFAEISPIEIEYYLQNFQPLDKAGSYGIQDWIGFCKIKHIEGEYANVMGLPISAIYEALLTF